MIPRLLAILVLLLSVAAPPARALESEYCGRLQKHFFDKLVQNIKNGDESTANIAKWDPSTWPKEAKGVGATEAPRGALGHWIKIRNTKIDNYQCIVPTTWNAGPRDAKNQIGAYEASLMNTKVAKADEPLEIIRTIHSFDPCLACATHVISPEGEEVTRVTVR